MNSLQYISNQVDSLIGNRKDAVDQVLDRAPVYGLDTAIADEESLYKEETVEPEADEKAPLLEPKAEQFIRSESVLVSVMLYVPRMVYFILAALFTPYKADKREVSSSEPYSKSRWLGLVVRTSTPPPPVAPPEELRRRLQSPYGKSVRLPRQHRPSSSISGMAGAESRILFPSRPLLPKHTPTRTLVLDLDETLIHSLSRSSKYSQGQMVEIKLDPSQLATLYLVNKRPFCDQFLQAVSQWYRLVIFTASVQAYADPMIDWLEQDRKYFHKRFYRHHCTQSPGGYIKDLSLVEPDLSRVLILDNSPVSYTHHKENAIGIEGWISDPSDHALLNLVPLLNALRYSTDVRSLLSLKKGEDAFAE
ncbi:nuclear envelope morphology protein 1 [Trichomonascus vanleenenianus]|uniref:Nem1-Spo7 phosphatase catalytic subunit NEM1 n=1 Tax=Trichomonascus vanleenenianus TaxID=2268995 RepID=UPI003ECA6D56